ncbi:hypothetical protein ZHAS_00021872 [Anopheles sinensis]|uniref:Thyroglobulin type-1 domain-containing protein n=1 Tax=Anopheles sinensis TaxID=74873 RepID=A0A084WT76_ANOSI|nr:hypothetical protein ZHAS_00021872 [Anopheles sinensis]
MKQRRGLTAMTDRDGLCSQNQSPLSPLPSATRMVVASPRRRLLSAVLFPSLSLSLYQACYLGGASECKRKQPLRSQQGARRKPAAARAPPMCRRRGGYVSPHCRRSLTLAHTVRKQVKHACTYGRQGNAIAIVCWCAECTQGTPDPQQRRGFRPQNKARIPACPYCVGVRRLFWRRRRHEIGRCETTRQQLPAAPVAGIPTRKGTDVKEPAAAPETKQGKFDHSRRSALTSRPR